MMEVSPDDVCAFGHQLVPGSDPIRLVTLDADGRKISEETKLLRRHSPYGVAIGKTKPSKVVAYPCDHALPEDQVPDDELPIHPLRGKSYGRAHWLTFTSVTIGKVFSLRAQCPVCLGQPAPDWRA